jgi:hypothetical protein
MAHRKKGAIRDVSDAARDMTDGGGLDSRTGKVAAGGAGAAGGALGGAAIGSIAGPIGTAIGAIAGAAGGWWAGKNVAQELSGFDEDEPFYRNRFDTTRPQGSKVIYEQAKPAYQLGYLAARNPDYSERRFEDIEPDLRRGWSSDLSNKYGDWNNVKPYVSEAFDRSRERAITGRSTTMRDEVTVDRRPVDETLAASDLGTDSDLRGSSRRRKGNLDEPRAG